MVMTGASEPSVRSAVGPASVPSSSGQLLGGVRVSSEEADAILQQLANHDDDSKKTWSRLVVEKYLSKYAWYWPGKDNPNGPSLSKAWAYYEHVTLPRHFIGDGSADTVLRRAEPGEYEYDTELYDWMRLKQATFIEWGTGVDLYFISLRFFAFLMLVCGLINIPAIMFYSSDKYNGDAPQDYAMVLRGSAVCNNTQWVVCTDCEFSDWSRDLGRIATGFSATGENATLVLRNLCGGATKEIGFTNFATIIFVLISLTVFSYYLHAREVRFDEDKVTTTDYSIVVDNPPPDALDTDQWRNFFSQFATNGDQVIAVTIALNNNVLVRKLVTRRVFLNQLKAQLLIEDLDLDDETAVYNAIIKYNEQKAMQEPNCISRILDWVVIPLSNLLNMLLPPEELVKKIKVLTKEIKELQEKTYTATNVFVTFETEEGQRTALDAMKVGLIDLKLNRTSAIQPECVFEGRVLNVHQPTEPTAVRWLDLQYGIIEKAVRRGIVLAVTFGMIGIAGVAISSARDRFGAKIAGFLTTIFNSTIPQVIKLLMIIEPHATEGAFQASLYLKITIFRWTLSAILAQIITPITSTLGFESTDLLPTTFAILLFDVWLGPLLRLSDWFTNLKKHILAPRTKTQEEMNLSFQGTFYNFGERYTDFTKILFVVFFYSALFPPGFFLGFLILTFQYMVDKFSLVRIWSWTPLIGSELAVFSRRFFFNAAALAFCIVSSYVFAQFPYDNLCDPNDPQSGYSGVYTNVLNGEDIPLQSITVEQDTNSVFCEQSWRGYVGFSFPPTPRIQTNDPSWLATPDESDLTWMTPQQERITFVYGWLSVAVSMAFIIALFGRTTYLAVISIFRGAYQPEGAIQHIDFSSNPEIFAYVPQIKLISQPFPYLVCDIDDIDQGLIGWNNPTHSYDFYNLIFDVPHKSLRRTKTIEDNTRGATTIAQHEEYKEDQDVEQTKSGFEVNTYASSSERPIYSIIKHYPTKWQIMLAEIEARDSQ